MTSSTAEQSYHSCDYFYWTAEQCLSNVPLRSKAQQSAAKRSKAQQSAAKRSKAQQSAAKRSKAQQSAAKRSKAQQSAAKRSKAQYSAAPVGGPKPALKLRTDHVPSLTQLDLTPGVPLVSDYDYDFSQFGHWDGDSASYYKECDHYSPSVLPHLHPKPLTPLASPPASVQKLEQDPSSINTQDKNASTNEPPSRPPSPITCPTTPRPATPLEYEGEAFPPLLHTQTQEEVCSVPQEPTPSSRSWYKVFLLPCPLNRVIQTNATIHRYYPSTSYYDISESSRIDSWVDPPLVLKNLVNLFEFGETWDTYAFNDFQDDLSAVVDACNDQLLFWHLSDRTPEQLILWTKSDYLWFNHIPPRRDYLIRQLQAGNSVRYLDRFRLSYEEIEITFYEIRVVDREGPPALVITEGTELTYSWERATWETTLNNPDHNLVNPRVYHQPPTDPNDPELVELLTARRTNPLSLLARLSLPASSPETEETNNSSNSSWGEEPNVGPCWCTQEVCICGYRPETPPTPEGVVLWSPGVNYLPFRESVVEL
ncbi:hypothetical protein EDB89DRAFT_1910579 [Lactarius sanguifluus]|nr:hypothetical protein EDB89DRAFT_1910579 [Lactarius sanguifluus]